MRSIRAATSVSALLFAICVAVLGSKPVESTLSAYRVVRVAEQEGAKFPHGVVEALPPTFGVRTIGTADRTCVEFPQTTSMVSRRSGDFEIGGQIAGLKADELGKVWWAPIHDPEAIEAMLIVRGSRLDQPAITSRFVSSHYAWPIIGADRHVVRDHAFYPSSFSLPSAGRWLLVATSGPDWGCFIVTVR